MDAAALGHRLREARLSKKMTQSEVVGDFITRNMLSQIESGAATPSVKTLTYLAGVLDLPLSALIADGDAEEWSSSAAVRTAGGGSSEQAAASADTSPLAQDWQRLQDAKAELCAQRFDEAIALLEPLRERFADEAAALLARAYYGRSCGGKTAASDAQTAAAYAGQGVYANRSLQADALLRCYESEKTR